MFKGFPGDMQGLMKKAQKMQEDMQRVKEQAGAIIESGSAGGGAVTVTVNGHQRIVSFKIAPELFESKDLSMLQDLLLLATNAALENAGEKFKEQINKVTGGIPIPGL
jgi:hypothetical protein